MAARLGRYVLDGVLGEGGQGRVHDAVLHGPAGLRKRVALKVLHGEGAGLKREARLGGLLRHPNLVDVYEVGEDEGTWFVALERCDGSLAGRPPLPPRAVVEVGLQVCAALQYAHEALGLVHLDLKPANLLVKDGVVKLADLGIARARGFEDDGRIRGTSGYMSPEQLRGGAVDARSDLFALGTCLVELATGRRAGASETFALDGPAPALDVPAWLAPVVDRCRAHDPDDRYPSAAALADALRAMDAGGERLREWLDPSAGPDPVAPLAPVALVGRQAELATVEAALERPCLLTLRGLGGVGKTRLAREVADRWRGEAHFVDLHAVTTSDGLRREVAAALGVLGVQGELDPEALGFALAARGDLLLVLDNVEQLVDEVGDLRSWMLQAPHLRLLVTSRTPTRVDGERVIEVQPLSEADAAELLAHRARDRGVDVAGDPAVPELVRRLAGIPLALELAAGRLGVLSPAEVLERLDLSLLRTGEAGVVPRQATLEAALAWSWEMLDELEQSALAQLSIFETPFRPEAAEAVLELGPDAPFVVDVLHALAERSLLVRHDQRLQLLEPVRAFAAERLRDATGVARRHGHTFAGWADHLDALEEHGGQSRFQVLAAENEDVLAACRRAIAAGDVEVALRALEVMVRVLTTLGPVGLALELVDEAVAAFPEHRGVLVEKRSRVIHCLGKEVLDLSDVEEAVAFARAEGDPRRLGRALVTLGTDLVRTDAERSETVLQEALYLPLTPAQRAIAHTYLASSRYRRGRSAEGAAALEQALSLCETHGLWRIHGPALSSTVLALATTGQLHEARRRVEEALTVSASPLLTPVLLKNAGVLALALGDPARALRRLEAAGSATRRLGHPALERDCLETYAHALLELGRHEEAVVVARPLIEASDGGLELLAMALLHLGREEELAGLLDQRPADRAVLARLELAQHRGDLAAALRIAGRADRGRRDVALWTTWLLLRQGRVDEARARLAEVGPHVPPEAPGVVLRAELASSLEEARTILDQAATWYGSPTIGRAWWLRGRARVLGDGSAREELRRLLPTLRLRPTHPLMF